MTGRVPASLHPRATVVVINQEGILLVKQSGDTLWALPGGRIAETETPIERAAHYVTQATGLRTTSLRFVGQYEGRVSANQIFVAETEGDLQPDCQYIQEARWWDGEEDLPLQDHVYAILAIILEQPEEDDSPETSAPGVASLEDYELEEATPGNEASGSDRVRSIAGTVGLAALTALKAFLLAMKVTGIGLVYATDGLISASLACQGTRPRPVKRKAYSQALRRSLHRAQGGRCIYCGKKLSLLMSHVDHIMPLNREAPTLRRMPSLPVPQCNTRKGDRTDHEFRTRYSSLIPTAPKSMPAQTVRQSAFKSATARTADASSYSGFKRGKYYTPAQKINIGAIVGGVAVGGLVYWLFYQAFAPEDPSNLVLTCALLAAATWGWVWVRGLVDR